MVCGVHDVGSTGTHRAYKLPDFQDAHRIRIPMG